MKILLTGATGFVGTALSRRLESAGHVVLPVSRRWGARYDWSDDGLARGVRVRRTLMLTRPNGPNISYRPATGTPITHATTGNINARRFIAVPPAFVSWQA